MRCTVEFEMSDGSLLSHAWQIPPATVEGGSESWFGMVMGFMTRGVVRDLRAALAETGRLQ